MARLPRFVIRSQSQHVIQRDNNKEVVFIADEDYFLLPSSSLRIYKATALMWLSWYTAFHSSAPNRFCFFTLSSSAVISYKTPCGTLLLNVLPILNKFLAAITCFMQLYLNFNERLNGVKYLLNILCSTLPFQNS